jgi:hypothetical protein
MSVRQVIHFLKVSSRKKMRTFQMTHQMHELTRKLGSSDSPKAISQTRGFVRSTKRRARLLSKVYEIDPMVCPKYGAEMKVIAIIQDPAEIDRILWHPGCQAEQQPKAATRLVKQRRPPPQVFE